MYYIKKRMHLFTYCNTNKRQPILTFPYTNMPLLNEYLTEQLMGANNNI